MRKYLGYMRSCLLLFLSLQFFSCATYYQKNYGFQKHFQNGDFQSALKFLESKKKAGKGKDRLLYYLDKGVVCSMLGKYELSNEYFTQADLYIEDFQRNY